MPVNGNLFKETTGVVWFSVYTIKKYYEVKILLVNGPTLLLLG